MGIHGNISKMRKLILICLLLGGCATAYKPNGFIGNGGFDETELAPNYYRVVFKGNEKTSKERAGDFALLRAAELMVNKNCATFQVVKSNNEIRTSNLFIPQTYTTNINTTSFGSTASTTSFGGGVATLNFPKAVLEVQCSNEKANINKSIYDSNFIIYSLKTKYEIK